MAIMAGFFWCIVLGLEFDPQHHILIHPFLLVFGILGLFLGGTHGLWRLLGWTILVQFTSREWTIGRRSVHNDNDIL